MSGPSGLPLSTRPLRRGPPSCPSVPPCSSPSVGAPMLRRARRGPVCAGATPRAPPRVSLQHEGRQRTDGQACTLRKPRVACAVRTARGFAPRSDVDGDDGDGGDRRGDAWGRRRLTGPRATQPVSSSAPPLQQQLHVTAAAVRLTRWPPRVCLYVCACLLWLPVARTRPQRRKHRSATHATPAQQASGDAGAGGRAGGNRPAWSPAKDYGVTGERVHRGRAVVFFELFRPAQRALAIRK